ncbi:methyltransferase domain-containing protein [Robiginitalea sp. IMCC44478]|uniref:methyltransferase domain-containing protein n=1 Tax=Robiginitalea sp. IMCC44478 TaxID=3459122 RepID=UPI0040430280
MNLNKEYWEARYRENRLGWDIGYAAPPITKYIDQLEDKNIRILIPGAGNGYEVEYLFRSGFKNIQVLDIAGLPLKRLQEKLPGLPGSAFLEMDFFELKQGPYDLILEQTFFCALPPAKRDRYAIKMAELLRQGGTLAGLLFDFPLTTQGPPFGGSASEYRQLFQPYFTIKTLERATNSIPPRQGTELFFIFEKK